MAGRVLVGVIVYDRYDNLKAWLHAWKQCEQHGANMVVVHNTDTPDAVDPAAVFRHCTGLIQRPNIGRDVGAFQAVVTDCYAKTTGGWEWLFWATDDFLPLSPKFLGEFLRFTGPDVGLVCARTPKVPNVDDHCRTNAFLISRKAATQLTFPSLAVRTLQECYAFEHGSHNMLRQVQAMGLKTPAIGDMDAQLLWDSGHEHYLHRWPRYLAAFGAPE